MNLSISELLMHSTIRIEVLNNQGIVESTGTGFFFSFDYEGKGSIPVMVTNKHVAINAKVGRLVFTIREKDNTPKYGEKFTYHIDRFESHFIFHPDPDVDLCVMPINPVLEDALIKHNKEFFIAPLDESCIPSDEAIKQLSALEEVVMIGYPIGLWDEYNNLPISRKGITAIHPKFEYKGKPDIVLDIACFPGSSGSPICILNQGAYTSSDGIMMGNRFLFLGILHSGPSQIVSGEIGAISMNIIPIAKTEVMINLGYAVKSRKLLDFKKILSDMAINIDKKR